MPQSATEGKGYDFLADQRLTSLMAGALAFVVIAMLSGKMVETAVDKYVFGGDDSQKGAV